jgi:hypothetical protein
MARKRQRFESFSDFRGGGRRKIAGHHFVGKSDALVTTVAERLIRRLTASAKRDSRPPCQPERFSGWIHNFEIALNANGAVRVDSDLGGRHQKRVTGNSRKSKDRS